MLRQVGLVPTIQRLAILDWLLATRQHPTADQVLSAVRKKYPSIARATVYNTLDALTKAGMILQLSVDSMVARYDADLGPHGHFHCRICRKVFDIGVPHGKTGGVGTDGHLVESVRTYAYGICAGCRRRGGRTPPQDGTGSNRNKHPDAASPSAPSRTDRKDPRNAS